MEIIAIETWSWKLYIYIYIYIYIYHRSMLARTSLWIGITARKTAMTSETL